MSVARQRRRRTPWSSSLQGTTGEQFSWELPPNSQSDKKDDGNERFFLVRSSYLGVGRSPLLGIASAPWLLWVLPWGCSGCREGVGIRRSSSSVFQQQVTEFLSKKETCICYPYFPAWVFYICSQVYFVFSHPNFFNSIPTNFPQLHHILGFRRPLSVIFYFVPRWISQISWLGQFQSNSALSMSRVWWVWQAT